MAIDFSKFDKAIDIDGLKQDVAEAAENGGTRREVPHGTYEVKIEKLELTESKKHDPMVSCWMRIVAGEYEKCMLFMNQVVTQGFQIHLANEFLRSLDSGIEVEFQSYSQYNQLLMDIAEEIDGQLEYAVEYGESKGYNTFKITEVFDVE
ncbi:DUF669 domain-containing protein [Sporomusa acidovorans]|uniref:DUF669 domain-containing protein n=1 Tax=Sporomusa acidovorans (strain ATCC 49682 / DSM 3132 / Mol) TaxID=1123286 RepID=A0ABZ3J6E5_SPOA4|nr:DUF669 domain-containing protein [Sporomusa acidovorans]OZC24182.1 hypothetical protein SPACI_01570 [Sporomusa acidovorans DSM 3132]SDF77798.1 hypothetical protein SAMN04488499_108116 [Sporomusa acidovorans]